MPQRYTDLGPGDLWDERPTRAELQAEEMGALETARDEALAEAERLRERLAEIEEADREDKQTVAEILADCDRLARILAVERGEAEHAPSGWRKVWAGAWSHGHYRVARMGDGRWDLIPPGTLSGVASYPTALEAMEAADAALEGAPHG